MAAFMNMKVLLLMVLLSALCDLAASYCYMQKVDGDHCVAPNGVVMPPGSDLVFQEKCERCSCHGSVHGGLSMGCCGFGIHAGVFAPPEGCKVVAGEDGCTVKLVLIADETQDCHLL